MAMSAKNKGMAYRMMFIEALTFALAPIWRVNSVLEKSTSDQSTQTAADCLGAQLDQHFVQRTLTFITKNYSLL